MIGYVTLGTNDIERAAVFYDALLGDLGAGRFMEMDGFIAWASVPPRAAEYQRPRGASPSRPAGLRSPGHPRALRRR